MTYYQIIQVILDVLATIVIFGAAITLAIIMCINPHAFYEHFEWYDHLPETEDDVASIKELEGE